MERWRQKDFLLSVAWALIMLVVAIVVNHFASIYTLERASNPVTDVILSNIRVFDVDFVFLYGPLLMWAIAIVLLVRRPDRVVFAIKSISLFILVRAIFVSLTHIGPFPGHLIFPPGNILAEFTTGSDLFFSGHTGLPFLLALIMWDNLKLRVFFILCSILFGIVVLLGHLHYSIDVLSAYFITYSIFHLSEILFKKDLSTSGGGL